MKKLKMPRTYLTVFAVILISAVLAVSGNDSLDQFIDSLYRTTGVSAPVSDITAELSVHFIDVGQANAILIQAPEQSVLIDAGDPDHSESLKAYLRSQNVSSLSLVLATHPHADHIGGMTDIVKSFPIDKILFPEIPKSLTPTTRTYEKLLDTIAAKKLKITRATPGNQYNLGGGAVLTLLGPVGNDQDDLNNVSIVCRLDYDEISYLFCGDAEKSAETAILEANPGPIDADVLGLGHHGSSTSTSAKWLRAVSPSIAIASCGADNSYGHPHAETLKRLADNDVTLYRTDRDGSIVIGTDGKSLSVVTER